MNWFLSHVSPCCLRSHKCRCSLARCGPTTFRSSKAPHQVDRMVRTYVHDLCRYKMEIHSTCSVSSPFLSALFLFPLLRELQRHARVVCACGPRVVLASCLPPGDSGIHALSPRLLGPRDDSFGAATLYHLAWLRILISLIRIAQFPFLEECGWLRTWGFVHSGSV